MDLAYAQLASLPGEISFQDGPTPSSPSQSGHTLTPSLSVTSQIESRYSNPSWSYSLPLVPEHSPITPYIMHREARVGMIWKHFPAVWFVWSLFLKLDYSTYEALASGLSPGRKCGRCLFFHGLGTRECGADVSPSFQFRSASVCPQTTFFSFLSFSFGLFYNHS